MAKKKTTEQPVEEDGLLTEQTPTDDEDTGQSEGQEESLQVQEETDSTQEEAISQAQGEGSPPSGQTVVRMLDDGRTKTVGVRAAALLVQHKRAEYVN